MTAGKTPGVRRLRQIIAEGRLGNQTQVLIANQAADRVDMNDLSSVVRVLTGTPEYRKAAEAEHVRFVAERRAHLDAIAKLEAQATKDYERQEARKAKSLAAEQACIAALKAAAAEYQKTLAAVAGERFAFESARRGHEVALLTADVPEFSLLIEFDAECDRHLTAARALLAWREETKRWRAAASCRARRPSCRSWGSEP